MVLDRLPGWNARDASSRWTARAAWTFAAAVVAVGIAAVIVQTSPLEEQVAPSQEGFPANDTFHDETNATTDDDEQPQPLGGRDFDDGGLGDGYRTEPEI